MRMRLAFPLLALAALAAAVVEAQQSVFTGTIASGDQYDLHTVFLVTGQQVGASLVCDFDGVSRPLDPVLSVFRPSNPDTDDVLLSDYYNDDGFGTDDFPWGVDCDAFDSSYVTFTAGETGDYTFRADGFGSSTGPYILTVDRADTWVSIPTLDEVGFAALALALAAAALILLRRRRAA